MADEARAVSAREFAALEKQNITVVDVREPDEILVHPVEGALNVPFSTFPRGLDDIPQGKPVYVLCRTGDFSEEVAEILADRGYTAYNVEGGYQALAALNAPVKNPAPVQAAAPAGKAEAKTVWWQRVFAGQKALKERNAAYLKIHTQISKRR